MVRTNLACVLLFATMAIAPALAQEHRGPKGPAPKGFMVASATVDAFIKGLRDGNLDAVMATVDVPWVQEGVMILKTRDDLRKFLSQPVQEQDLSALKAEVNEVQNFKSVRNKGGGADELLRQVAKDDDLVFRMKIAYESNSETLMLLVRVRGATAKIIGAGN